MVVDGEPASRDLRLAGHRCAVRRGHEAGTELESRQHDDELMRNPVVPHLHLEAAAALQGVLRCDDEFLPGPRPLCRFAVDLYLADRHPDQVEVEAAQRLCRLRLDRGLAVEDIRRRVVGDLQVVVADVVPTVAVGRVVGVSEARRTGFATGSRALGRDVRLRRGGNTQGDRARDRGDRGEGSSRSERSSGHSDLLQGARLPRPGRTAST